MPLGQFIPGDSQLHRLDPRTKLAGLAVLVYSLFWLDTWWNYFLALALIVPLFFVAHLPLSLLFRMKSVWLIVAMTGLFHLFFTRHGEVLVALGPFAVYEGGLLDGTRWTLRIVIVVLGASLLTWTTSPLALTQALARLFGPLRKVKVPIDALAFMVSQALAFIPLFWQEADRLIRAQKSRGAPFDHGPLVKRVGAYLSILIPLFLAVIRRAEALAVAMEVRGYRGERERTAFRSLKLTGADYITFTLLVIYITALLVVGGAGSW